MAMPRADVDDQWIWRSCSARKWSAEPRINGLANHMFYHGSRWRLYSDCHNERDFPPETTKVNIFLATSFNISHIQARMTAEERKHRIEGYLQKVEFAALEELARHVGASV